jgi:hypothetical protein
VLEKESFVGEREILFALTREQCGELNAVVGRTRLFAQYGDVEFVMLGNQPLQQALTDHSVADDDQSLSY